MLRFTTGGGGSGCDPVIVALVVNAPGGTTRLKLPAETIPPSSPIVLVVVYESEPSRLSVCDDPSFSAAPPLGAGIAGSVGRLEQPASEPTRNRRRRGTKPTRRCACMTLSS